MEPWKAFALVCPALLAAAAVTAVEAQDLPGEVSVGVELVLAVDTSRSIDPAEQQIQRRGYAQAFREAEVQNTILDGIWGRVAITYVEWADEAVQNVVVPWTLIDSTQAARDFAALIETGEPRWASSTSISGGIAFAAGLFDQNGFAGLRRIIDVSGDGPNNQGLAVTAARDAVLKRGITINGLPLMTNGRRDFAFGFGGWSTIENLDAYYAECVIGGPGSFSIPVKSWDQFAAAVRQKLVLELAGRLPPQRERIFRVGAPAPIDCLIGEKMRSERERRLGD